jgi:hypothetical protein
VRDTRKSQGLRYSLPLLAFCVLFTEFVGNRRQRQRAAWLKGNWEWISQLAQDHGLEGNFDSSPSQSTLSRFFSKGDEYAIKQLYLAELRLRELNNFKEAQRDSPTVASELTQYCVDGKRREGCISEETGRTEIDLTMMNAGTRTVHLWGVCPDKEGEAVTARKIISMYGSEIPAGLFTFDAGITGPGFISGLVHKGHFYIAAIKGNAGKVFNEIQSADWAKSAMRATVSEKKAHGRQETRTIEILRTTAFPSRSLSKYTKCGSVLRVTREFTEGKKTSCETRYFIASKGLGTLTPLEFLARVRAHWIQENGLHWCKDAILGEDDLPKQSHKSSRLLGFMKSIVVSLGYQLQKSVQKFIDLCAGNPRKVIESLFYSG